MSLFMVVILSVSLFVSSMFTGIKPSATTVALSRDSSISVFFTSILKRVSFGKRFLYSGKDPSSFLKDAENFSEASDVVSKLNQLGKYGQFELGKITDPTNLSAVQQGLANALEAKQGDVNNPLSPGAALQREKTRFVTGQQRLDKEFNQRGQELDRANQLAMMTLQNQIANQQQNFNLTRMEMDYRNRREDRMDERNRRKEEQAMIMMLIRGLTQGVGNAFN